MWCASSSCLQFEWWEGEQPTQYTLCGSLWLSESNPPSQPMISSCCLWKLMDFWLNNTEYMSSGKLMKTTFWQILQDILVYMKVSIAQRNIQCVFNHIANLSNYWATKSTEHRPNIGPVSQNLDNNTNTHQWNDKVKPEAKSFCQKQRMNNELPPEAYCDWKAIFNPPPPFQLPTPYPYPPKNKLSNNIRLEAFLFTFLSRLTRQGLKCSCFFSFSWD